MPGKGARARYRAKQRDKRLKQKRDRKASNEYLRLGSKGTGKNQKKRRKIANGGSPSPAPKLPSSRRGKRRQRRMTGVGVAGKQRCTKVL